MINVLLCNGFFDCASVLTKSFDKMTFSLACALNVAFENCGKNAKRAWERDCDSDGAAASSAGVGRLIARLPMPTLLAARGIAARTSRSLSRLLVLRSSRPHRFSRKRETARSLHLNEIRLRRAGDVMSCTSFFVVREKSVRHSSLRNERTRLAPI